MIYALVFLTGVAGLTWEVLWLHHAALAMGVSAQGAAITFASVMLGMAAGSVLMARILSKRPGLHPLRAYAVLELVIGFSGLWLAPGFALLGELDARVYAGTPAIAPLIHTAGIVLLLGIPSCAMGATMPIFASFAIRAGHSLARMYAANVAGASAGIMLTALWLIPNLGMEITGALTTSLNLLVAAILLLMAIAGRPALSAPIESQAGEESTDSPPMPAMLIAFSTGFATFVLEVTWFRSLRAAYQATTESSALVLSAALIGLALGAHLASSLRKRRLASIELVLIAAGLATLIASPIVERFDLLAPTGGTTYFAFTAQRFGAALLLLTPCFLLVGIGLPWVLEENLRPRQIATLYAVNTGGSVLGSVLTAWIFLPSIGAVRAGWIAAVPLLLCASLVSRSARVRLAATGAGVLGLTVAVAGESGVGRLRFQNDALHAMAPKLIAARESADSTVSVAEYSNGTRALIIDGFYASEEEKQSHYMAWMGRLPMLMHPRPKNALVICFGTGQTADAVRDEGPEHLDVVELSEAVLEMAPLFPENDAVLSDPRVSAIVMDGRAWLRRTSRRYDVVTLEPMPPTFAGSNALYSLEFYELVRARSTEGAIVAQWVPFHLITPLEAASIVATFREVFPDAKLWIDPLAPTGILLGTTRTGTTAPAELWPGLARNAEGRDLAGEEIRAALKFDHRVLEVYARLGSVITDDNQLLSYGYGRLLAFGTGSTATAASLRALEQIAARIQP